MKVLVPLDITDAMIIDSSLFETAPAVYNAGTTYALNAYVAVAGTLGEVLIYKSLQAGNLNNTPASSPTWWEYSSSTYEVYSSVRTYPKDFLVLDPATHIVYKSIVSSNQGRPLDIVANPIWLLYGKTTLSPTPATYSSGTTYATGDIVIKTTVTSSDYTDIFGNNYTSGTIKSVRAYVSSHGSNLNNDPSAPNSTHWTLDPLYPLGYDRDSNYPAGYVAQDVAGITYQSAINNNRNMPFSAAQPWVAVGISNKFSPFDSKSSTQAKAKKTMSFTVAPGVIEAVGLINALGDYADVTVRDGLGGAIVYQSGSGLSGGEVSDYYDYFWSNPFIQKTQALFSDIPPYINSHVTITITSTGDVCLGDAMFGRFNDAGLTLFGLQAGITDFSVVTTNDFGYATFTPRENIKFLDSRSWISKEDFNRAFVMLRTLPAKPCLWVAADDDQLGEALMLKAFFRDFTMDIANVQECYCSLKLIGVL